VITVGFTLWQIARDPQVRISISNATYPMAIQFLNQIKNHIQRNEEFKKIFGDFSVNADAWREDRIFVSREKSYAQKEATVSAYGMGANMVGSHFDVAILDDVVARENISTKDQIEKVKDYYKDVLDLVDQTASGHKRVIIIGTCWHWDDLYAWIQNKENNLLNDFAILKLPAYEGEWGSGKLLFPTRLTWKLMQKLKEQQGISHYSAQYLLNPVPTEFQTFKPPFRHYEETDLAGVELKKFMTIDPALSEDKDADFSAMICMGVDKNNAWYILDIWREQVLPSRLIDQVFYWNEKWKPISIGLETTAYQRVLQYQINDEMKKRNQFIPIKELGHTERSKDDRIRGLQPRYETGTVFHPLKESVPKVEYLEDELQRFPKGAHDDMIDALASQLELAFPPRARETRERRQHEAYPA
jgi:predicted phage terminase large subunit-like protein